LPDLKIEELNSFDIKLIEEIKSLEIENLGSQAAINEWIIPVIIRYGKFFILRTSPGIIIGTCQILKKWDDKGCAFIHSFYISAGYRHKGYGRFFLKKILNTLKGSGIKSIELTVDPQNEIALSLYRNLGFKKVLLKKDEYGPGRDRYLFRRIL